MKFIKSISNLALVTLFMLSTIAWADGDSARLLGFPLRPRIGEFVSVYGGNLPAANPIPDKKTDRMVYLQNNPAALAKVIVEFERTFPGATWAFLGRDAAFLADLFDSFYRSIGQVDRVVRLDASGETIRSANNAQRMNFLMNSGLDPLRLESGHPFVMVDATRYGAGDGVNVHRSQSKQLMDSVFEHLEQNGLNARRFTRKVNFINIQPDMYKPYVIPDLDPNTFLREQEVVMTKHGPNEILTIDASKMSYGDIDWHGKFSVMQYTAAGKAFATPVAAGTLDAKRTILYEQYEMMKLVNHGNFQDLVRQQAAQYGFNFPFSARPAPKPIDLSVPGYAEEGVVKRLIARLRFVYTEMKILDKETQIKKLNHDLARHGKKDPIGVYLGIIDSGVLNELKDFRIPEIKHTVPNLTETLLSRTKNPMGLLEFLNRLDPKAAIANMQMVLPITKKPSQFIDLAKKLGANLANHPQLATVIEHFFSLNPDANDFFELSKLVPASVLEKSQFQSNLFAARNTKEFLDKLEAFEIHIKAGHAASLAKAFLKFKPAPFEIEKFKTILREKERVHGGASIIPLTEAYFNYANVRSAENFVIAIKKNKGYAKDIQADALNHNIDLLLATRPDIETLSKILDAIDFTSQLDLDTKLISYGMEIARSTEDVIRLVKGKPFTSGTEQWIEALDRALYPNDQKQSVVSIMSLFVSKAKSLAEVIAMSRELNLGQDYFNMMIQSYWKQAKNISSQEVIEISKYVYQSNFKKPTDLVWNAFLKLESLGASEKEIVQLVQQSTLASDLPNAEKSKILSTLMIDISQKPLAERVRIVKLSDGLFINSSAFSEILAAIYEDSEQKGTHKLFDSLDSRGIEQLVDGLRIANNAKQKMYFQWASANIGKLSFEESLNAFKRMNQVAPESSPYLATILNRELSKRAPLTVSQVKLLMNEIPYSANVYFTESNSLVNQVVQAASSLDEIRSVLVSIQEQGIARGTPLLISITSGLVPSQGLTIRALEPFLIDRAQLIQFLEDVRLKAHVSQLLAARLLVPDTSPDEFLRIGKAIMQDGVSEEFLLANLATVRKPTVEFTLNLFRMMNISNAMQAKIVKTLTPRLQDPQNIRLLKMKGFSVTSIRNNMGIFMKSISNHFGTDYGNDGVRSSLAAPLCRNALTAP